MDRSVPHGQRFTEGEQPYNAVRLEVGIVGQLYFARSFIAAPDISVSAIGTSDAHAVFSVGSRLLSVQGGLANAVLSALLGGSVTLSAMDYRALVDSNVTLAHVLSALATEVGVTGGTYGEVLNASATIGTVFSALVRAANESGQQQAAQVVRTLRSEIRLDATVPLGALIDLGPFSRAEADQTQSALGASVNVMSLISALATFANGNEQVTVNLTSVVPGLLSLKLDLAIGEPSQKSSWVALGPVGATVRTAQTRLRLVAEVGGSGPLSGVRVRLPLYIELAHAEARLRSLACAGTQAPDAVIEARPSVVMAWIGEVAPGGLSSFSTDISVSAGKIIQAPLIAVRGVGYVEMGNAATSDLRFTRMDVDERVVKTAEVRDYLSSLTAHLLKNADLQVDILGLGIGLGSISSIKLQVFSLLAPVTVALDSLLVPLLEVMGVHLGEVDVQVNGMRCGSAVLSG
jgi:uncharacterized membrane protein